MFAYDGTTVSFTLIFILTITIPKINNDFSIFYINVNIVNRYVFKTILYSHAICKFNIHNNKHIAHVELTYITHRYLIIDRYFVFEITSWLILKSCTTFWPETERRSDTRWNLNGMMLMVEHEKNCIGYRLFL